MSDDRTTERHIHLDLMGGLAGDIFIAAALDAGLVDKSSLEEALSQVGLGNIEIVDQRALRGAVEGLHIRFQGWDPEMEADHRHLSTIETMIGDSDLEAPVKERALAMFRTLGKAEAEVHGMSLEEVHFHEVGAVDSLLDFVGAAWIIEQAQATWSYGEIPLGSGSIETAHGTIPVPAPATAKLLAGQPVAYQPVEHEFVTPTGATILATLKGLSGERRGRIRSTGFGSGGRDVAGISNVARMTVLEKKGDRVAKGFVEDEVVELIAEIDDQSPEQLAYVLERLQEEGALDAHLTAVTMKKGRVGQRLWVLCADEASARAMAEVIVRESTTLGMRVRRSERWILKREAIALPTDYGELDIKLGFFDDEVVQAQPEYESCRRLAREQGVALREVYEAGRRAIESWREEI